MARLLQNSRWSHLLTIPCAAAILLLAASLAAAQSPDRSARAPGDAHGFTGSSNSTAALSRPSFSDTELLQFARSLDLIAKQSKRGEKAVEFRRLLLKAMAAPTHAEYRRIMRPFHERKTYARATVKFTPESQPAFGAEAGRRSSGPSATLAAVTEVCTTDVFGTVYVDECTTDEEVQEVWDEFAAMHAELAADQAEQIDLCKSRVADPNRCEYVTDDELGYDAADRAEEESPDASTTLLDLDEAPVGRGCNATAISPTGFAAIAAREDCINSAIAATGSFMMWLTEKDTVRSWGMRIAKQGLKSAQVRVLAGGFLAGFAIGMAINCWFE